MQYCCENCAPLGYLGQIDMGEPSGDHFWQIGPGGPLWLLCSVWWPVWVDWPGSALWWLLWAHWPGSDPWTIWADFLGSQRAYGPVAS